MVNLPRSSLETDNRQSQGVNNILTLKVIDS